MERILIPLLIYAALFGLRALKKSRGAGSAKTGSQQPGTLVSGNAPRAKTFDELFKEFTEAPQAQSVAQNAQSQVKSKPANASYFPDNGESAYNDYAEEASDRKSLTRQEPENIPDEALETKRAIMQYQARVKELNNQEPQKVDSFQKSTYKEYAITEAAPNPYTEQLRQKEGLRNAFILSEILKPKF